MLLAENLIPSRRIHSISEAVISLFLVQPIVKPSRFKELLSKDERFKSRFQHFRLSQRLKLSAKFKSGNEGIKETDFSSAEPEDNGFLFESFKDGELEYILKCDNTESTYVLSIHSFQYHRWATFIADISVFLECISNFQSNIFIKSIGLSYVDQFNWVGGNSFPMQSVFKAGNEYLPKNIMNSIGEWTYSSGLKGLADHKNMIEQVNLDLRSQAKNNFLLTLSHSCGKDFSSDIVEISKSSIENFIVPESSKMHEFNKKFLRSSLDNDVLKIIGIN